MKKFDALIILAMILFSTFSILRIDVNAEEVYPTIDDVGITFWSTSTSLPGPITASKGGHLRLWYFINNPNPGPMSLVLGASIADYEGAPEIHDPPNDEIVQVSPGYAVYSRFFEIPSDADIGTYDVAYGLWLSDWSAQIGLVWKTDWLTVSNPVPVTLSSSVIGGGSNVGYVEFGTETYSLPNTVYAETRMHMAHALPPSGYILDHWETSGEVGFSDQGFGYVSVYVYGSGGITAFYRSAPTFDMKVIYSQLEVAPGASVTSVIYLGSLNGFSGLIDLSLGWSDGRPSWVLQDSFSEDPIYLPEGGQVTSTLTISIDDPADAGVYFPEVFAVSGSLVQQAELELTVLKRYTVTFELGNYELIIDGNLFPPSWGSVSFTWLSNEYHYFYMTSPFYMPFDGRTILFREWNDGVKINYRNTGWSEGGEIPLEDATYYPLWIEYYYFPVITHSDGGSVAISPEPGPYGWLWGTIITATAIPYPGMLFDHWTFMDPGGEEWIYGDINPLEAMAVGPPLIITAYFSTPPPPPIAPIAILSLLSESNTFHVGEAVPFSGYQSYARAGEGVYVVSYFFDFGDGYSSDWVGSYGTAHPYESPGTYSVRLKVIDNCGYESDWSNLIEIHIEQTGYFELEITPPSQSVGSPKRVYYEIILTSVNGFDSEVTLAVSITPLFSGGSWEIENFHLTPTPDGVAETTLKVNTYEDIIAQTYQILVTGAGGGKEDSCVASLHVHFVNGIETVVTIDDFQVKPKPQENLLFSIQQNVVIPITYEVVGDYYIPNESYYVQNVIVVGGNPGSYKMYAGYDIWKWTPSERKLVIHYFEKDLNIFHEYQGEVVMRTTIYGSELWIENDFIRHTFSLPCLGFIDTFINDIVLVGPIGSTPTATFLSPTSGHIDAYFLLNSGNWIPGNIDSISESGITAERSEGLTFYDDILAVVYSCDPGDFDSPVDSHDHIGFQINPDFSASSVDPPSVPVQASTLSSIMIELQCPANLSLYDSAGCHLGYNSLTNLFDAEIPDALYCFAEETEWVVLFCLGVEYDLQVIGETSGVFTLEVTFRNEVGDLVTLSNASGATSAGTTLHYTISVDAAGYPVVIMWEYIFTDPNRNTIMRISTNDRCFQFIAPDKTFCVKHDPDMLIVMHVIGIHFEDEELRLDSTSIDTRLNICVVHATDIQTGKIYSLVDRPDISVRLLLRMFRLEMLEQW